MIKDSKAPQAFPYSGIGDDLNYSKGMTLRDYLAAHASNEDYERHASKGFREEYVYEDFDGNKSIKSRAAFWTDEEAKYRYADAMIKARST